MLLIFMRAAVTASYLSLVGDCPGMDAMSGRKRGGLWRWASVSLTKTVDECLSCFGLVIEGFGFCEALGHHDELDGWLHDCFLNRRPRDEILWMRRRVVAPTARQYVALVPRSLHYVRYLPPF
ncbi:hypothetical protein HDK64DRAFT_267360 [Phyllosticta capitalensis]